MRALGLTLLIACGRAPAPPPEPLGNHGAPAAAMDAAPADASACVVSCIQRNQMRATGPEVIAAECRAECARER